MLASTPCFNDLHTMVTSPKCLSRLTFLLILIVVGRRHSPALLTDSCTLHSLGPYASQMMNEPSRLQGLSTNCDCCNDFCRLAHSQVWVAHDKHLVRNSTTTSWLYRTMVVLVRTRRVGCVVLLLLYSRATCFPTGGVTVVVVLKMVDTVLLGQSEDGVNQGHLTLEATGQPSSSSRL